MANVLVEENSLRAIANAIREKNGSNATYYPADMASAILAIESGGDSGSVREPVLEPLEVSQNGIYIPGEGVDGFSQVTVEVPSTTLERGVVVNATDANGNWTDVVIYGEFPATMFKGNTTLQKVALVGIEDIPANAFNGCTKLASLTLPSGLKTIGDSSFLNCTALTQVVIPEGVTSIGDSAFKATKIVEITIPASVTTFKNYAFHNCTALTTVHWKPLAVAKAGAYNYPPFKGCTALTSFTFAEGMTILPEAILAGTTAIKEVIIPETVTTIGNDAFYNSTGLTSITIPASVNSVGLHSFYKCTALKDVYWNAPAISLVGSSSCPPFNGCSALTNFVIADNVTTLPTYMLKQCTGITSITIPASVKTIGNYAFETTSLTEIIIYATANSISGSPWGASSATISWAV